MVFINRSRELEFLEERWRREKCELIIIWGKRRVGKTELVKQFIKKKPHIYFLAESTNESAQLKRFSEVVGRFFQDSFLQKRGFGDWLESFEYIKNKGKRIALVIDEFPYLIQSNPAIVSLFQKAWDEYWKDTVLYVILLGSSIAMMETEVLGYRSPLYGRRTGQWRLEPLDFFDATGFFPQLDFEEKIKYFAVAGGIPAYWLEFDKNENFWSNIKNRVVKKGELLYEEVEFLLREELREPRYYFAILTAISQGKRRLSEIVNATGLARPIVNKYLSVLAELKIVERELPVTESRPLKSKKGLYRILDPFFNFWFQFIFPQRSALEMGEAEMVLKNIKNKFPQFLASIYERVAVDILRYYHHRLFSFSNIGRWWDKDLEIDIVAFNAEKNEILFGEVKWTGKELGTNVYEELKEKSGKLIWGTQKRKEYFCLFSKSGFTTSMKELAKRESIFLFEKDKLLNL